MPEQFQLSAEEWQQAVRMGGKNAWLNNDHPLTTPISYNGNLFRTVEAAYKFAKYQQFPQENTLILSQCVDEARSAQDIRDVEHDANLQLKISEYWHETKYGIMLVLNREKYAWNADLAAMLVSTHPHPIVEVTRKFDRSGKPWGDAYWGVCVAEDNDILKAIGCNAMGRIAMQIREELRAID